MESESQHSKRLSVVGGLGTDCLAAYRAISLPHSRRLLAYHEPVRQLLVLWAGLGGHRPCWNRTLLSAARSLEAAFRFSCICSSCQHYFAYRRSLHCLHRFSRLSVIAHNPSNQSLAIVKSTFDFTKQFSMFAMLAAASDG